MPTEHGLEDIGVGLYVHMRRIVIKLPWLIEFTVKWRIILVTRLNFLETVADAALLDKYLINLQNWFFIYKDGFREKTAIEEWVVSNLISPEFELNSLRLIRESDDAYSRN